MVGSTYMAACGLQPGRRYSDDSNFEERDKQENVATITKFAAAMFEKLKAMNREHLQDFRLRVGESGGRGGGSRRGWVPVCHSSVSQTFMGATLMIVLAWAGDPECVNM